MANPGVYAQDGSYEGGSQEELFKKAFEADKLLNDPETFEILKEGILPDVEETAKAKRIKNDFLEAKKLYEEFDQSIETQTITLRSNNTASTTYSNNVSAAVVEDLLLGDHLQLGILDEVIENKYLWETSIVTPTEKDNLELYGRKQNFKVIEMNPWPLSQVSNVYPDELTTLSGAEKTAQLIAQLIRYNELGLREKEEGEEFETYIFIHQDQIIDKLQLILNLLDRLDAEYKDAITLLKHRIKNPIDEALLQQDQLSLQKLAGLDKNLKERRKRIENLIKMIRSIRPDKKLGEVPEPKIEEENSSLLNPTLSDKNRSTKNTSTFPKVISPSSVHSL